MPKKKGRRKKSMVKLGKKMKKFKKKRLGKRTKRSNQQMDPDPQKETENFLLEEAPFE